MKYAFKFQDQDFECEMKYYWKCCDQDKSATSLEDAKMQLEDHEASAHKGKLLGVFGWERVEGSLKGSDMSLAAHACLESNAR